MTDDRVLLELECGAIQYEDPQEIKPAHGIAFCSYHPHESSGGGWQKIKARWTHREEVEERYERPRLVMHTQHATILDYARRLEPIAEWARRLLDNPEVRNNWNEGERLLKRAGH